MHVQDLAGQKSFYLYKHATFFRETYGTKRNLPLWLIICLSIPVSAIIILTILGNLLVLCFKARVGRTNTTLLVWNLGLTDFLVGIIVLPLGAIHLLTGEWRMGRILCRLWISMDVTFVTSSIVTICCISADRYLAVTNPLKSKLFFTKRRVIMIIITIWTFSSLILLTTVRWEQPSNLDDTVCFAGNEIRYLAHSVVFAFFLPASVTLTLYWRIYKLARERQKALDRGFLMILGQNMNFLTNTLAQQHTTLRVHIGRKNGIAEHQRRVLRTHERIAKTLGVVSFSFLFCWLPFFILYMTNYQCNNCIPTIFIEAGSWLGYVNSMFNPIIYSSQIREYKTSFIRLIFPFWKFSHRVLPRVFNAPPEHVRSKINRNAKVRSKNKNPGRHKDNWVSQSKEIVVREKTPVSSFIQKVDQQDHHPSIPINSYHAKHKSPSKKIISKEPIEDPSIPSITCGNDVEGQMMYDSDSITLHSDDEILASHLMFRHDSTRRRSITISDFSNIETLSKTGSEEHLNGNGKNLLIANGLRKNSKSFNLHDNKTTILRIDTAPKSKKKRKRKQGVDETRTILPPSLPSQTKDKDSLHVLCLTNAEDV
uniref:G_PROTEIN_RECEP_F1_2 domain-containing protein n=1 Tax=Rhabditophanes sp. KR3021 TaxID=114890 RepID=A0AC35U8H6_9BILA